jgi:hypothetical protein
MSGVPRTVEEAIARIEGLAAGGEVVAQPDRIAVRILLATLREFARYIMRGAPPGDHACAECIDESILNEEMVKPDFRCVFHTARGLVQR